jgi:uncharacterized protein (DUF1810 family)
MSDPFDLQRFVDAQAPVFAEVCAELAEGRKRGHWIWFIFPQIKGLGSSPIAQYFGVSCLDEAAAYLRHPILGPRLRDCTELVNRLEGHSAYDIFGSPDDLKFRSCMTLFIRASSDNAIFKRALDKYYRGQFDPLTLARLGETS